VQDEAAITISGLLTILVLLRRVPDKRTILQLDEETNASEHKWQWYSVWISVCYFRSNETPTALIKIFSNQNNNSESRDSEPTSAREKKIRRAPGKKAMKRRYCCSGARQPPACYTAEAIAGAK
jgi:hypothetical protein